MWRGSCRPCPVRGAACEGNIPGRDLLNLASKPGFWRLPSDPGSGNNSVPQFLPCIYSTTACPSSSNGSCYPGYRGVLCAVCERGYHQDPTGCNHCGKLSVNVIVGVGIGLLAIILVFAYISRRVNTRQLVSALKVTVGWLQVIGSTSSSYSIPWPSSMSGLIGFFRVALFDIYQITAIGIFFFPSLPLFLEMKKRKSELTG